MNNKELESDISDAKRLYNAIKNAEMFINGCTEEFKEAELEWRRQALLATLCMFKKDVLSMIKEWEKDSVTKEIKKIVDQIEKFPFMKGKES